MHPKYLKITVWYFLFSFKIIIILCFLMYIFIKSDFCTEDFVYSVIEVVMDELKYL